MSKQENSAYEKIGKSLGRIPSGVAILTAKQEHQDAAMLSSWFQQVSFEPPMIAVAIKKGRPIESVLESSEKFVLNILHTGQKDMLAHFGRGFEPGVYPFEGVAIETRLTGVPVLKQALGFMECQLRHVYEAGDHRIFVAEVVNAGAEEEGQPMVHLRRSGFHY